MLVIQRRVEPPLHADAELPLPFELRQKSRLRTKLATGEEVGLFLDRGAILRGGDCLEAQDGRIVRVVAAPEALMEVANGDARALARAAYHLGNRHTPVEVGEGRLRFAADHVLAEMLRGLGLAFQASRSSQLSRWGNPLRWNGARWREAFDWGCRRDSRCR